MSFRIPLRIPSCHQQLFLSFQNYPIFCIGMARLRHWRFKAKDKESRLPLSLLHFSSILFYFSVPTPRRAMPAYAPFMFRKGFLGGRLLDRLLYSQ